MIVCPKCKAEIEVDSHVCDQCGFELRFCSQCGKPGKGNRCTYCGGIMQTVAEQLQPAVLNGEITAPTVLNNTGSVRGLSVPQLFLLNAEQNIRIEGVNGAVLGRRNGPYQSMLGKCAYVYDHDLFLLCSDGLTDMLADEKIEAILLRSVDSEQLVDAACKAGGVDNISACTVQFSFN